MNNKKIAITGGIGSGKSTVAEILREQGFTVFSCDEIYKEIIRSTEYIQSVQELFPQAVIHNEIDKKKLAEIVFSDEGCRRSLNDLAHPLIMKKLLEYMENTESDPVFAEVPLLFEENLEHFFDEIWVVIRALDIRIQSAVNRDRCNEEDVLRRIKTQFDYESKDSFEYFKNINAVIIENDNGKNELKEKIKHLIV